MTSTIAKTAFGAFAAFALGSAARAADVDINARTEEYGSYHRLIGDEDREGDDDDRRCHEGFEERLLGRERGRFYGRPVPEWPIMGRLVFARPSWGRHEEDRRLIVRRRVDRWGNVVIRRIRVCD